VKLNRHRTFAGADAVNRPSAGYPTRWRRRGLSVRPRCLVSPDP